MFSVIRNFLFSNQTIRQTVAKNTFWMAFGQFGGRMCRALIIIYAARILGATEWGVFSYAVGFVAFLTIFTDFGISPVLTRETVRTGDPEHRSRIISTAFISKLVLLFFGVLVVIFIAPRIASIKEAAALFPIVAFVFVFDTLREFGFSLNRALEKMEWEAGLYILTNVAIVSFGFLFLYYSPNVFSFSYAYAIGTGIGAFATFYVLRSHFKNLFYYFSPHLLLPLLAAAWPFALSSAIGSLTINTDILMIGAFRSAADVGFYSAAQRPVQILYLIPGILAVSLFPTLSRIAFEDKERLRSILERVISMAFLFAIPIAIGGIILASGIITILFGADYMNSVRPLQILLLTIMINFPATLLSNAIFALDEQKKLVSFAAIAGLSNVALDLLLIPYLGIVGAAITTVFAQFISNAYLWKHLKRLTHFSVLLHLKNIVFATILMGAIVKLGAILHINTMMNIQENIKELRLHSLMVKQLPLKQLT